MRPQVLVLARIELKHDILGKPFPVPPDGFVQALGFHLIKSRQLDIEQHLVFADEPNSARYPG